MSRHRLTGPLLVEPGQVDLGRAEPGRAEPGRAEPGRVDVVRVDAVRDRTGDDALAQLLGHTELERLYGMVVAFPRAADRLVTERRVPDPVLRYTLRAEAALRLNRPREAVTLASSAVDHAVQQQPIDPGRLLPAMTVLVDAAVVAGAPDAVTSCAGLADLARDFSDELRATVAAGLHAVAVFQQQSCRDAMHLLNRLLHGSTDGGTAAVIAAAREAVQTCCTRKGRPHWPPASLPAVTAGGLVQPALTPLFLPDRFQRWPGIHDCGPAPRTSRPFA